MPFCEIGRLLVSNYVQHGIRLRVPTKTDARMVAVQREAQIAVELLKQLVWMYVIENQALLTLQAGQRVVIRRLFEFFRENAEKKRFDVFAQPYRALLEEAARAGYLERDYVRIVIDMVAGKGETQALRLHHRLSGVSLGSVLDRM